MFVLALAVAIHTARLVHRGLAYEVRIDPNGARPLQVWRHGHKVAEALLKSFHIWSVQIADVDGDGIDEIAVGVTKPTTHLPFPHRTLFIMRFDGRQIWRKWTGSTMGRPLVDFCFGPKAPGKPQILYTLEKRMDGKIALAPNRWNGFGFTKTGKELAWDRAGGLSCKGINLTLFADRRNVTVSCKSLQ